MPEPPADRGPAGYASEAARTFVDWALGDPEIREVTARSDAGNEASARVLIAAGLTRARRTGRSGPLAADGDQTRSLVRSRSRRQRDADRSQL